MNTMPSGAFGAAAVFLAGDVGCALGAVFPAALRAGEADVSWRTSTLEAELDAAMDGPGFALSQPSDAMQAEKSQAVTLERIMGRVIRRAAQASHVCDILRSP